MNPRRTRRLSRIALNVACGFALSTCSVLPRVVAQHEHHPPDPQGEQRPGEPGRHYRPVVPPNGVALPWKLVDGVKVFHLIAEEVRHAFDTWLRCAAALRFPSSSRTLLRAAGSSPFRRASAPAAQP